VSALIRAELLKLRTRSLAGLLIASIVLVPLTVATDIPRTTTSDASMQLADPRLLAVAVGDGFSVALVLAFLIGAVAFTQEYRYGTITPTYLVEPRRHRVLIAKFGSITLTSAAISTVTAAVAVPFAVLLIDARNGSVHLGARFWQTLVVAYVVMAVYAIIGVAIGALVRNQITVIVTALVWMLAVEHLAVPTHPSIGRWMPLATTISLLQLRPVYDPDHELLSVLPSGLLLATYCAVTVGLALRLIPRRDVL
jgi:ABC-type transport system involved in multi-copper enzyme maturation permease subunit